MQVESGNRYDAAQLEAGKIGVRRELTLFQGLLEAAVASLRPLAAGKGLQLTISMPGEDIMAWTDRRLFSQIVLCLLRNAIKATHQGSVHLFLDLRTVDGKKMIEIDIIDTGAGISPGEQAALFSPLPGVHPAVVASAGNTGLRLPLCQQLAGLLGGKIGVQSECGKGSTFTFLLPRG